MEWYITPPHTSFNGQRQHWLHISCLIRKMVFHILVRRYFSSLRPYLIKCCTNNQFVDQTEINFYFQHCKFRQSVRIKTTWLWDTYKLHVQCVDQCQCDTMLELQYISHRYHSAMIKISFAVYSCMLVTSYEQYNIHSRNTGIHITVSYLRLFKLSFLISTLGVAGRCLLLFFFVLIWTAPIIYRSNSVWVVECTVVVLCISSAAVNGAMSKLCIVVGRAVCV
jgi:hypothetical protein